MLGYATIFTSFPIFALIFIEDVTYEQAMGYPQLYKALQEGREINIKTFLCWTWMSIWQAMVIMLCSLQFFENSFMEIVTITFTSLVIIEMLNVASEIRNYHPIIVGSLLGSLLVYLFCLFVIPKYLMLSSLTGHMMLKILGIVVISWSPFKLYFSMQYCMFPNNLDKIRKEAREKARRQNKSQNDS